MEEPPCRIPWNHPHSKAPRVPFESGTGFEPSSPAPDLGGGRDLSGPPGRPDQQSRLGLVIEFEPLVADQLLDRAFRSLILGALAAGLLMLTALFFWRATIRQESDERTMEEQRRLSTLGEFSAVLAHEIRNPLASLKGHAQLLAERMPDDAPEGGRVKRIVTEAQRLEDLTTDLLDFVRTGPLDLAPVAVDDFSRPLSRRPGATP